MNLVCNIIFIITAILTIIYDYKYKRIPIFILISNYIAISLLLNKYLLFGLVFIYIYKKLDKPIDIIYVLVLGYSIITKMNFLSIISIIIVLLYALLSKSKYISFMVPLEIALLIEIYCI